MVSLLTFQLSYNYTLIVFLLCFFVIVFLLCFFVLTKVDKKIYYLLVVCKRQELQNERGHVL